MTGFEGADPVRFSDSELAGHCVKEEPTNADLQDLACAVSDALYGGELAWTMQPMSTTIAALRNRMGPKLGFWARIKKILKVPVL